MRRREFITLLSGAAAWPVAAQAQQPAMPVVGYLDVYAPEPTGIFLAAFRNGLSEVGYLEGRNVAIEYRYANSDNARLPELASDLVRRGVAVIVAPFGTAAVRAAKSATTTIPIVFMTSADPVQEGLVTTFNRPGGNVTGLSTMNVELGAKRLGLLHEVSADCRANQSHQCDSRATHPRGSGGRFDDWVAGRCRVRQYKSRH